MMIKKEKITVTCQDGVVLKGVLLIPESPKAVVQFNGGTGAKKEFYLPFLSYLCEHNYICCLWDYRGSGDSAPQNMSDCQYRFADYGLQDMPAIKQFLTQKFETLPLLLFTHSVGGQQIGFMPDLKGYKGMVSFAISTGYLGHMPLGFLLQTLFFFYVFSPLSSLFTGYVSAKKLGIMEDLPKNVVREWRDWCEKENYFFDKKFLDKTVPNRHFQEIPFPVHIIWTTDDPIANKNSVPTFWSNVKGKEGITFEKIIPKEFGLKQIRHFGFFKKKMKGILWQKGVDKLDEFLEKSKV